MRYFLVLVALLLTGCTAFHGTAWNHQSQECRQEEDLMHQNGLWSQPLCRDGRGVMIWIDYSC